MRSDRVVRGGPGVRSRYQTGAVAGAAVWISYLTAGTVAGVAAIAAIAGLPIGLDAVSYRSRHAPTAAPATPTP
jgi:hypothetical protein